MDINLYSKDSVGSISSANFLRQGDLDFLNSRAETIQDNFEKKQMWRTETEINVSVLNNLKFPTNAAKYWQSVKESSIFFENLVVLSFDYKRELVNIKKLNRSLEQEEDELERESLQIDIEEALFKKKNMELAAKDRVRELRIWDKKMKELSDGSFDTKDVNTHQEVSLAQRFIREYMSSANSNKSPSETINLEGQLASSLDNLKNKGKLDELSSIMTSAESAAFPLVGKESKHVERKKKHSLID